MGRGADRGAWRSRWCFQGEWVGARLAMPRWVGRLPRYALVEEGSYNHCSWRSHDQAFTLESPEAKQKFLGLVAHYKPRFGIRVLSYCVMGNHPHLVLVCDRGQAAFSAFFRLVNQRFARWYNCRHARRGQVV